MCPNRKRSCEQRLVKKGGVSVEEYDSRAWGATQSARLDRSGWIGETIGGVFSSTLDPQESKYWFGLGGVFSSTLDPQESKYWFGSRFSIFCFHSSDFCFVEETPYHLWLWRWGVGKDHLWLWRWELERMMAAVGGGSNPKEGNRAEQEGTPSILG